MRIFPKGTVATNHRKRINNILVEGGSKVASTFLNQDFTDIIYIYKSSNFIGKEGLDSMGSLKLNKNFSLYNEIDLEDNELDALKAASKAVKTKVEELNSIINQ